MMPQSWFELQDIRKGHLEGRVWIPLRSIQTLLKEGENGHAGFREEFFGAASIAVPLSQKVEAEALGWTDVGIMHSHFPDTSGDEYETVDIARERGGVVGARLVVEQRGNSAEPLQWHLSHDFVVALGLKREGDEWVAIDEGYEVVARLMHNERGGPHLLEVRAEHLKDYLCARRMALYVSSYRQRVEITDSVDHIDWPGAHAVAKSGLDRWEGRVDEIHEGGMPFGATTAVFHAVRTDIDPSDDVPVMGPPTEANVRSRQWTESARGRKLYRLRGELWRTEWIEPAPHSPRVRHDEVHPVVTYITDATGTRTLAENLDDEGRWLWFRPDVVPALSHRRGGALRWYTRDTGDVRCSPDYRVHFGVNALGLVTVLAKDVATLPEWQQRIWAGHNVTPEGGVSDELLQSQVNAEPAETLAPEAFIGDAISEVNDASLACLGFQLVRTENHDGLLNKLHRFRALDESGLFALAKDVIRATADSFDTRALQKVVPPPKGKTLGSLKSLELVLAAKLDPDTAASLLAPLFGAYDLRVADAHPSSSDLSRARANARVDAASPFVRQGEQLLSACVTALYQIADGLRLYCPDTAAQVS